jgi:serine/threonine protein kinase
VTNAAQQSADLQRLIGRTFVDRYRVDSLLGTGAMGSVFKGHQLTLKRDCAIKILHPELMSDENIAKRFEREAESAARLEHPNIMQVLEQGTTKDGLKFIVMQLLEGGELADRLDRPMPAAQSVIWAIQIFSALEHAHANGVIHRDLKPENVFVSTDHDGREILKLVDFGIAKIVGGPSDSTAEPMTKLGLVFGTPAYMSPEQATGVETDARTDLYSAGVILHQMLAGSPPFFNEDPVALIRMQVSLDPPPLPDHVPLELRAIVSKLLAKQRDGRFKSATEAREALESLLPNLDLDGLAIPSHVVRDVSGVIASASMPLSIPLADALEPTGTPITPHPVAPEPKRGSGKGIVVLGLLLAGAGAAAWFAWPQDSGRGPTNESGPAETEGQVADPLAGIEHAPADELAEIDRLLLAKSADPALALIKPLRDQYTDDPQLLWREGKALALKKNKRDTALVRYGEALDVDPSLVEDQDFYAELYDLLDDRRLRAEALDFAVQRLGESGHKFLLGLVNEKNPDRALRYNDRHRALDELAGDPVNGALINHELNLARDLWQAPQALTPCAAYRDALVAISVAPDPLFLSTLRRRGVPKKPANDEDALICDALPDLRAQVLASYEAAYDPAAAGRKADGEAGGEPGPAPEEPAPDAGKTGSGAKGSGSKGSGSKKKKKGGKKKKKNPFEQFGKDLEGAFGGK